MSNGKRLASRNHKQSEVIMDQPATAVESGEVKVEQTAQQSQNAEPMTVEKINEIFQSRDPQRIEEARKLLFDTPNEAEAPVPPPAAEAPAESAPAAAPATPEAPAAKPKFAVNVRGELVEVDDDDGFIGYRNAEQLKRSKVHADLHIKNLEKSETTLRNERDTLAAQIAELQKKLSTSPPPQAPSAPPAADAPPAFTRPAAPTYPEIPDDPTDWTSDDARKFKTYQVEIASYNTQLADFIEKSRNMVVPEDRIAQLVAERTKPLEERFQMSEKELNELRQQRARDLQAEADRKHWEQFAMFQSQHSEFATPLPVHQMHGEIIKWTDKLAEAHGLRKPYDMNSPEFSKYESERDVIVGKYLQKDPATLQTASGITPPDGYDKYFNLADTVAKLKDLKDRYVASNQLAQNATWHQVYLLHLDETGELNRDINDLRAEERKKGVEAMSNALRSAGETATTIPNAMAQSGDTPDGLSKDSLEWFQNIGPQQLRRLSPDDQKKYTSIAMALGFIK